MRPFGLILLACVSTAVAAAQSNPLPAPSASGPPAKSAAPPDGYVYEPGTRRDPFVNPIGTGAEPRLSPKRGEGVAGLTVTEIAVRGVLESRGVFVAMVQGPGTKTFLVHQGDKLADGTIKAITAQGLVIVQDVTDPLSLVKQREIRRLLRSFEPVKE